MAGNSRRKKCYDRQRAQQHGAGAGPAPKTTTTAPGAPGGFVFTNTNSISTNFAVPAAQTPTQAPWTPFGQGQTQTQPQLQPGHQTPIWNASPPQAQQSQPQGGFQFQQGITLPSSSAPAATSLGIPLTSSPSTGFATPIPSSTSTTWSYPLCQPLTATGVSATPGTSASTSAQVTAVGNQQQSGLSLPCSNPLFAVPVLPPQHQPPPQLLQPGQLFPLGYGPAAESMCVSPFRELEPLPCSDDSLVQKLDKIRLEAQESRTAHKDKEVKVAEDKAQLRVRSYEIPSTEEYSQIVAGHVFRLQHYMKSRIWDAKLLNSGTSTTSSISRPKPGVGVLINRDTGAAVGLGARNYKVQAEPDMYARQRAQRHWKLITSMDARMVRNVPCASASESGPRTEGGGRLPLKTSWARLDKSVVNNLLQKKAKLETEGPEAEYESEFFTNHNQNHGGESGVILKSPLYYCKPSVSELGALTVTRSNGDSPPTRACLVPNFEVGHELFGKIEFLGEINVAGINLDKTIRFRHGKVQLYYGDEPVPPLGQGLHHPFVATLHRMRPAAPSVRPKRIGDCINPERSPMSGEYDRTATITSDMIRTYERMLRQTCGRFGAEFIDYNYSKGTWTFRVDRLDS